ncbi:DsbA family protein [Demequina muriae]|uniref:Thioredoxin domain-containing protein n=1 Tax=Demequina muriae TaxID=3051664 RepID=A0ABT8GFD0_9MICO|nr:thioredoxin domain-containing protein [Demequina sp. EGI L300058]MDN4480125.1 thioredoxin domain-containing protein [Demequina sp. EGI L300058]
MAKNKETGTNDKVAAARKQAQQQVKAQERRTVALIVAGVAVVALIFGGIVWYIIQQASVPDLESGDAVAPVGADETGGILIGMDGAAGGEAPEDAPRLDIYEDFMCPVCGQFEEINKDDIDAMREAGDIQLYVHPISILDHYSQGSNFSTRAANAAATVADAAPEQIVPFMSAMYQNQPAEGTTGLSDEQIEQIAIDAGVPEDVAGTLADGRFTKWVIAATDRSSQDGVPGTPAVMVDRVMLDQAEVPYFQPGALRSHIEGL